jgi:molybdopterin biosynthesis enzyme
VPVEATDGRTDVVRVNAPSAEGSHIRRAGGDVAAGTTVLRAGQVVTPAVVGLAAALGLHELTVIPHQRVLVISTGSELVSPGMPQGAGRVAGTPIVTLPGNPVSALVSFEVSSVRRCAQPWGYGLRNGRGDPPC